MAGALSRLRSVRLGARRSLAARGGRKRDACRLPDDDLLFGGTLVNRLLSSLSRIVASFEEFQTYKTGDAWYALLFPFCRFARTPRALDERAADLGSVHPQLIATHGRQ